jgi:antitoxin (DNA-binding transcriptional repressor) of toxin-antitoxin stability system
MSTIQVNMHEAKSQLSQLGEKAWSGETVIVAKAGKPYLDLTPHKVVRPPRKPGRYKNQIMLSPQFDPTPGDIIDAVEGKE